MQPWEVSTERSAVGSRLVLCPTLVPCCLPQQQPTLDLLQQHDPDAAASIRSVLKLPAESFQQLLEVEQLPHDTSKQQYMAHAVRQLLVDSVWWQLAAVRQGFAAGTSVQVSGWCVPGSLA